MTISGDQRVRRRFCRPERALSPMAALVATLLLPAGCAERDLAPIRTLTYPPDFNYITREELSGRMADLARDVGAIDALLTREGGARASDRDAIVGLLEQLRSHSMQLGHGRDSNHPQLQHGAERLARDVDRALNGARLEPPDFTWAARLTGGCTNCHAPRRPGAA